MAVKETCHELYELERINADKIINQNTFVHEGLNANL